MNVWKPVTILSFYIGYTTYHDPGDRVHTAIINIVCTSLQLGVYNINIMVDITTKMMDVTL